MTFCRLEKTETIFVHPHDDIDEYGTIEIITNGNEPIFAVSIDNGDNTYVWEFSCYCPSDLDRVRLMIFDYVDMCNDMDELCETLGKELEECFSEIMIKD